MCVCVCASACACARACQAWGERERERAEYSKPTDLAVVVLPPDGVCADGRGRTATAVPRGRNPDEERSVAQLPNPRGRGLKKDST